MKSIKQETRILRTVERTRYLRENKTLSIYLFARKVGCNGEWGLGKSVTMDWRRRQYTEKC